MAFSVTGISGSVRRPSRTSTLVRTLLATVDRRLDPDGHLYQQETLRPICVSEGLAPKPDTHRDRSIKRLTIIEMAESAPVIFSSLTRAQTSTASEAIVRSVETADALIVATPVYRASYTGALKHLFDLVDYQALVGKPVILAATGNGYLHGLVTEHQLRPLLSFFGALTVPTAIYASEADFVEYTLTSAAVLERIDRAADEIARLIASPPPSARLSATDRQLVTATL
jgi:FMN reductase